MLLLTWNELGLMRIGVFKINYIIIIVYNAETQTYIFNIN